MISAREKHRQRSGDRSLSSSSRRLKLQAVSTDFEEPLSDDAGSGRESDETLLCDSITALDMEIDKMVNDDQQQTPRALPSSAGMNSSPHWTQFGSHDELSTDDNLMKYRDNYAALWKGYKRILRDHSKLVSKIAGKTPRDNDSPAQNISHYLNDFALKISAKKKRAEKKLLDECICQDIDTFVAKKWKRRYFNILEAIDLIFNDYQMMVAYLSEGPESADALLAPSEIQRRLNEISSDSYESGKFQMEGDTSITLSAIFVSDLLSQLQVYRYELLSVYKKKERLIQILSQSKRQKAELKGIVYRLRNDLQYTSKKLKESQEAMAKQISTKTQPSSAAVSKKVAEATAELQTQRKCEIIRYEDRICELEKMLREEECKRKKLHNKLQELVGNIRVYCRIRPCSNTCLKVESDDKVIVTSTELPERVVRMWTSAMKCFIFDRVFNPQASQDDVFESVGPLIVSCVDGYNVCIMAYGQTGSGKTYTMMGTQEFPGVNRRAISELLSVCKSRRQWTFRLKLSVIEIYQEEARDLLTTANSSSTSNVKIMSSQDDDVVICGLSEYPVATQEDILSLLGRAEKNRSVAPHLLNHSSSRSHLIVLLKIEGQNKIHDTTSRGILTLCDLAGSENINKSGATFGERFNEATSINKSLTTLGRVFDSLRRRQKPAYRETKLTFLLKPTLGGDSKCLLFINARAEPTNVEETVRALQFGQNAMQVIPEQTQIKLASQRRSNVR